MTGDHEGVYYPLTGMSKEVQQQLIDDHFLFKVKLLINICFDINFFRKETDFFRQPMHVGIGQLEEEYSTTT